MFKRRINRFLLFSLIGFFSAIVVAGVLLYYLKPVIYQNPHSAALSFTLSLIEDIFFFGLVGSFAFLAQFAPGGGEVLRERLKRLFANQEVSHSALEYLEQRVRNTAIYSDRSAHKLVVREYDPELYAYKVEFQNDYKLHNMFGDVSYDAELSVEIAPDLVRDGVQPLAVVTNLSLKADGRGEKKFIYGPQEIGAEGFSQPVRVFLPKRGSALYRMQWWSWVSNIGNSGFSLKRFSERFLIEVENASNVTVIIFTGRGNRQEKTIPPGRSLIIADENQVGEGARVDFFWGPPTEHPEPDPYNEERELHPILKSDHRHGDNVVQKLIER